MVKNFSVKHLIFYVSILIILVSFGYYTSYAFFSTVVEGNEDATNTEVTLANIETTFETTSYINNERLIPLLATEVDEKAKKVEFTVTNTENSDIPIQFNIFLEDFLISDNFTLSEDLRYKITKMELGTEVLVAEGNFTESTSGENFKLTKKKETLNYNSSREYILRIWIHDTGEEQPDLLEGTISGRVSVIGKIAKTPKCRRAITSELHTEKCEQEVTNVNYYCSAEGSIGYNNFVTYGNQIYTEGQLNTGDAFTCDVNDDDIYDEETERFYYISDLYTGTVDGVNNFNEDYAVLVYYSNTKVENDEVIQNNIDGTRYNSYNRNYDGPVSAIQHIPSIKEWNNVRLYSQSRQLNNETGNQTYYSGRFPLSKYSYTNKTARLLTYQEVANGCTITNENPNSSALLGNENCMFLLENTKFTNNNNLHGYFLETACYWNAYSVWNISANITKTVYCDYSNGAVDVQYNPPYGVRPVIEVLKDEIIY